MPDNQTRDSSLAGKLQEEKLGEALIAGTGALSGAGDLRQVAKNFRKLTESHAGIFTFNGEWYLSGRRMKPGNYVVSRIDEPEAREPLF